MSEAAAQPLVSVVTPVYNGEQYLAECMESVLAQTYERWEYVLCDNASTDRTPEIAREIAARDERVRVQRFDELLPIIPNWNRAMRQISPDSAYVKVVHADDRLYPACLERMVAAGERFPTAAIVSAYRWRDDVGRSTVLTPSDLEFVPGREIARRTLVGEIEVFGSPTTTLLRADSVRARADFYDLDFLHADTEACFRLLGAGDLAFVHEVLTYSRLHPQAETNFAGRVGTWQPERIAMLIRYGPGVLDDAEYAATLRRMLSVYAYQLTKRAVRLRLLHDRRMREYHARVLRRISDALAEDHLSGGMVTSARFATAALGRLLGGARGDGTPARSTAR